MTAINTDNEIAMEVMRLAGVVDEIAYHLTNVMFGDDPVNFDKAAVTAALGDLGIQLRNFVDAEVGQTQEHSLTTLKNQINDMSAAFLQFDNAADWQAVPAVSNRVTEMERLYARLMCYTVAP
ncbi:hypothetical protein ABNZ43_05315 [Weissella sp. GP1]|uniref:Uncharacterized protein n=2 Tax=Weissella TaxID=46255 RepID=A0AAJ2YVG9_WEICO|nr:MULTISPECIES: hypothetical protein [Weissella]MBJ7688213.1 hypothetical protein [Weissella confusa]MBJ7693955.1 hypothetical protein [Weissella confusa]MCW0926093.1 hypothetical protein [Weissella sp. LMG 11983]MDF9300357.1 hypothetical protein [Weissella sp. BK2]NBA10884.1 hypothetical protein [Weissella confusa]